MSVATNSITEISQPKTLDRLRDFIANFEALLDRGADESELLREGSSLLGELVSEDNWLPDRYAQPAGDRYSQYLLHLDNADRFSVVSFVWGPGQTTPIHNHTTWGLIGMLRGAEVEQHYVRRIDGTLAQEGEPHSLQIGEVDAVSPRIGDLHRVSNAYTDRISISIHVYGGNIGKIERAVYGLDGTRKTFISGYSNQKPSSVSNRPAGLSSEEEQ
jgi:predicted metal-dependent enzyme (double-stranded beta helix superfamily)